MQVARLGPGGRLQPDRSGQNCSGPSLRALPGCGGRRDLAANRVGCGQAGVPAATVLGEVGQQLVHGFEPCSVDHVTPFLSGTDESGMCQLLEMERQRRRRDAGDLADFTGSQSGRPGLHKCTECRQARDMTQGGECGRCRFNFHISNNIEIWKEVNDRTVAMPGYEAHHKKLMRQQRGAGPVRNGCAGWDRARSLVRYHLQNNEMQCRR